MSIDVLAGLLDEKLIRILSLFLNFPDKSFSLTDVSRFSRVNNATTFRTLNKLVSEELIKVTVIGKVRTYQLSTGERAIALTKLLKIDDIIDPINSFCQKASQISKIKKIILDSRDSNKSKLIIIGESSSKEKLKKISDEIKLNHNFKIDFVEITLPQYEGLKDTSMFNSSKKILYESK